MSPSRIEPRVVTEKVAVVERMLASLGELPAGDLESFLEDPRTPAAAESFLRRALEALLDLGRHVLAKGFGLPVNEYEEIADHLHEKEVLGATERETLRRMAKYRNRMVHFDDEITPVELHGIVTEHLDDFRTILGAVSAWLADHPKRLRSE